MDYPALATRLGNPTTCHIFLGDKGDYYDIDGA